VSTSSERTGPGSADPLAPLTRLPGVPEAVAEARAAVAEAHAHPANRRDFSASAAEAAVRAARASAGLEGGQLELPEDPDALVSDPMLAGALRVADELGGLLRVWQRAPLQALARLHVLAAADLAGEEALGRPGTAGDVPARLDVLAELLTGGTRAPGPVLAAVVHGELLALGAFAPVGGVVARAASRLTVISTGLDTQGLAVPEVFWWRSPQRYAEAAAGFALGDPGALGRWITYCCEALVAGGAEATGIADSRGA
jgi:hypothetical protein